MSSISSKKEQKQVDLRFQSSKVEFVHSFFGGNFSLKKSFRLCLTFKVNQKWLFSGFGLKTWEINYYFWVRNRDFQPSISIFSFQFKSLVWLLSSLRAWCISSQLLLRNLNSILVGLYCSQQYRPTFAKGGHKERAVYHVLRKRRFISP